MTDSNLLLQIQEIFRDVFDEAALEINRGMNFGDFEAWDSLNHINLLVALEQEFSCKFSLTEMTELINVGRMVDIIAGKSS
jgi:acyl carrier protein